MDRWKNVKIWCYRSDRPTLHFVNCDNYIHLGSHLYVNVVAPLQAATSGYTPHLDIFTRQNCSKTSKASKYPLWQHLWEIFFPVYLILIVTNSSRKSLTFVWQIITPTLSKSVNENQNGNILNHSISQFQVTLSWFWILINVFVILFFYDLKKKITFSRCTAAAKYDMVTLHKAELTDLSPLSPTTPHLDKVTPKTWKRWLQHGGTRFITFFSGKFDKIPLFFTL